MWKDDLNICVWVFVGDGPTVYCCVKENHETIFSQTVSSEKMYLLQLKNWIGNNIKGVIIQHPGWLFNLKNRFV